MSNGWNSFFDILRRMSRHVSRPNTPSENHSSIDLSGRRARPGFVEDGFTLTEIMVSISLMAILTALSIGALSYYFSNRSLDTAVTEITAQIREAQTLAVATGNTYRIDFSDPSLSSYSLQRRSGSDWIIVRNAMHLPSGVVFDAASLPDFGGDRYLEFYARGNAESGQLNLTGRYGKTRNMNMDGATANVW